MNMVRQAEAALLIALRRAFDDVRPYSGWHIEGQFESEVFSKAITHLAQALNVLEGREDAE